MILSTQVLATMFISVSQALPKTSYIKMVDVWLIFNLMIPFFEVLSRYPLTSLIMNDFRLSFTPRLIALEVMKTEKSIIMENQGKLEVRNIFN